MPAITSARAGSLAIGELSRLTGVHIETIRYYERVGMLIAPSRTAGGRRLYDHGYVRTLAFIRRARELGFTLEEIRALVELSGSERPSCAEVRKIASHHLEDVRRKLADLTRLEAILAETVARCVRNASPVCPVLDMLSNGSDA
jgi:MerR family transcriptional regulator, mercuric resistance operon regulatory protein